MSRKEVFSRNLQILLAELHKEKDFSFSFLDDIIFSDMNSIELICKYIMEEEEEN